MNGWGYSVVRRAIKKTRHKPGFLVEQQESYKAAASCSRRTRSLSI